jgi:hypothetical protein
MQGKVWRRLLDEVLDEELPRYAEALERSRPVIFARR